MRHWSQKWATALGLLPSVGLSPLAFFAVPCVRAQKPWTRVSVLIGLSLLTAACLDFGEFPADAIAIRNESSRTIEIVAMVRPGDEQVISTLERGLGTLFRDDCLDPDLEARTQDGRVVARREGPFCRGDAEWVITDDG